MIHIEHSIQIDRPRGEVFAYLTDPSHLPAWQKGIAEVKLLDAGPVRIGWRFEETVRSGFVKFRMTCTVTDLKSGERFGLDAVSNGPFDCKARYDLQATGGGTRLTFVGTARLKGLWRLLQPMLARELTRETRGELEALKTLVEQAQPATTAIANPA
jgi:uncharacterized protein YndB with AHSA1/START domain